MKKWMKNLWTLEYSGLKKLVMDSTLFPMGF